MKTNINIMMEGKLEIERVENPNGLPYIEIVYRVGRQRNWILLNKEQREELVKTLQEIEL